MLKAENGFHYCLYVPRTQQHEFRNNAFPKSASEKLRLPRTATNMVLNW
jgi:hypothetical protein